MLACCGMRALLRLPAAAGDEIIRVRQVALRRAARPSAASDPSARPQLRRLAHPQPLREREASLLAAGRRRRHLVGLLLPLGDSALVVAGAASGGAAAEGERADRALALAAVACLHERWSRRGVRSRRRKSEMVWPTQTATRSAPPSPAMRCVSAVVPALCKCGETGEEEGGRGGGKTFNHSRILNRA